MAKKKKKKKVKAKRGKMDLVYVNVSKLKEWKDNPRSNDEAAEKLTVLIEKHGFINPIIATPDGTIRAGHTRLKAALKLGMKEVPVIYVPFDTEAEATMFAIADNKASEWAKWDEKLLVKLMGKHRGVSVDQMAEGTGFSKSEIQWFGSQSDSSKFNTDPDDVPKAPKKAKTKLGDIWVMGNHRLLCGDATQESAMRRLMAGKEANLLLTDPPYNVAYTGKTKDSLTLQNDGMSDADFRTFLIDAFTCADYVLRPGGSYYIWHADSEGYNFRGSCQDVGWKVRQCLIWVKNVMVMGRQDYHWKHEPCLYGWKPGAAHKWQTDRKQTTVLEFARPSRSVDHPTMKPVALFEYLMNNSSRRKQIVLDPFAGSGTTVIAAEKLHRKARVMELDPVYCDVIVRRWEEFTGKKAKRKTKRRK